MLRFSWVEPGLAQCKGISVGLQSSCLAKSNIQSKGDAPGSSAPNDSSAPPISVFSWYLSLLG